MTCSWFAFRTKPMMARRAERGLTEQGFEFLIPLARRTIVRRGREHDIVHPLFWTYGFVRFDPDHDRWQAIYSTAGVVGLVGPMSEDCSKPPPPIRDAEMIALKTRIAEEGGAIEVDRKIILGPGVMVRIIYGAFEGKVGEISSCDGSRVEVLLKLVGAVRPVPFRKDFVEAA